MSSLESQIAQKNQYGKAFYATNLDVGQTRTGMNHFPYTSFYRGQYNLSEPVIFDRRAGYSHVGVNCYDTKTKYEVAYPNYCYETACSTIYPCVPGQLIADTRAWVWRSP
jgi:hypothetical protein